MFQGRQVQKGKSLVTGDMDGETIWNGNLNREIYRRQLLPNATFDGSEYLEGRFRNANDENLNPVRRNYNTNRYDLNEFDLCNELRGMHVGNDPNDDLILPRFGESSYTRANPCVSYPGNSITDPTEIPYLAQKEFLARNRYYNSDHGEKSFQIPTHWEEDNDVLRRQNGPISKLPHWEDTIVLDGNPSDHRSDKSSFYSSSYLPSNPVPYQNYIYVMAKDQQGCRFLQRKLGEETDEGVQIIFNEIISHVVELMMDPFGNYLIQKLLEICDEEQRLKIVLMVTKVPGDLVRVSLNAHGTRAVQKLIETIKTGQQISLVIMALKPGFLDLVKDPNGNHVIQHCLEQFSVEDNKFIFSAAERFCVAIATHQHGCCVMNRCIAHSIGRDHENLTAKVASNGLKLAQDAFGNYVVQYIIELKIPSVAAILMSQFEGNYWALSTQKFSSHVIEKCLKFIEYSRPRIVNELLNVPRFDQLLQDPYANYVIKSALENTKGHVHSSLKKAVNSHPILRTSPYCKKIFSQNRVKT